MIKNDIEFILMERKPGGYRKPTLASRVLSVIAAEDHQRWFQQIWTGVTGASTRAILLPTRLRSRSDSFACLASLGDTVLDPFLGSGTTSMAAMRYGRNSIGIELDEEYFGMAKRRIDAAASDFSAKRG